MSSNPNSSDFDYKKYSLEKLQDWVHDALSTGEASPHEIYSAIREAVREDYYYHKDRLSRASGLLELLSGHRPVGDKPNYEVWEEHYYPEEAKRSEHYYDYTRNDPNRKNPFEKVKKWSLPVEADPSGEYFVTFPDDLLEASNLKEGDQVEWVDQGDGSYLLKKVEKNAPTYDEMVASGYTMTDDGFWLPPQDC
jgi:hypothetical protein